MINYDLKKIRALIFDVDGVLSDSNVLLMGGQPVRTANTKDGYALQHAAKTDLKLAIITGGRNETIKERYMGLGISDIFMGVSVKIDVYRDYLIANGLRSEEVLYMGDDIPDYEVMKLAGCPCCPKDACTEIKQIATYISDYKGGYGVARDILEQVMKAQGKWVMNAKAFGW